MLDSLFFLDVAILKFINVKLAHPWLDQFWLVMTQLHKQVWFQFGILPLVLGWLFYIYRLQAFKVIVAVAIGVAITDLLAYRAIKGLVNRPRPFQNLEVSHQIRKVGEAHGPSFPSNHSANCFAGAVILTWYFSRRRNLFYNIAGLVAISRVALGVHYPSDVFGGAILGVTVGFLFNTFVLNNVRLLTLHEGVPSSDAKSDPLSTRTRRLEDH